MQVGGCSGAGAGQAAPVLAAVKLQHAQSAHLDSEHQLGLEGIREQQKRDAAQLAHERRGGRTAGRARARQEREERRQRQLGQPEAMPVPAQAQPL